MKIKNIIAITLIGLFFSSCYEEYSPIDDLVEIKGDVAQVSSLTSPVTAAKAESVIDLIMRCHAVGSEMESIMIYERVGGTSGPYTFKEEIPFVPNFVAAERLHVVTIPYTVPNEPGKNFSLSVAVKTKNGLVSALRTMTPVNVAIQ